MSGDFDTPLLVWGLLIVFGLALGQALRRRMAARAAREATAEEVEIRVVRRHPLKPLQAGPKPQPFAVPFAANASGAAADPDDTIRRLARTLMSLAEKRDPRTAALARRAAARVTTLAAGHGVSGPDVERAALAAMMLKLGPAALPESLRVAGSGDSFSTDMLDHARLEGAIPDLVRAVRDGAPVEPRLDKLVALVREAGDH
ncbi:MAG: hypothetical protein NBV67_04905 [Tagaea sp.]|nr:hypothetical protein [Tagaea sp.]